jgi:hypothetical protein
VIDFIVLIVKWLSPFTLRDGALDFAGKYPVMSAVSIERELGL